MREIKFRFFYNNGMHCVTSISFDGMYAQFFDNNLKCYATGSLKDGNLMQYTGIKDKNGVEIYEGDILKDTISKKEQLREVCLDTGTFILRNYEDEFQPRCGFYCITNCEVFDGEVIGNIYENPELLEESK